MSKRALYSVIQFWPDLARAEGINIGIALVCPGVGTRTVMSANNVAIKKAFGARFDGKRLDAVKRSLKVRLDALPQSFESFETFINSQANNLVLLPPRWTMTEDPDATATSLFAELVGERKRPTRRGSPHGPNLTEFFTPLFTAGLPNLRKDVEVQIPTLHKTLTAEVAYRNGGLNYVLGYGFPGDEHSALEKAKSIGGDGLLLSKHADAASGLAQRMVVAGRLKDERMADTIKALLSDFNVRLVREAELQAFVAEVREASLH